MCLDGVEVGGLPAEGAEALLLVAPVHLRREPHHVHLQGKERREGDFSLNFSTYFTRIFSVRRYFQKVFKDTDLVP